MVLPIITYGNSILRRKSIDVHVKTDELDILINNMFETIQHADGVGLAANQVDSPLNLFIVNFKNGDDELKEVFINSKITNYSDEKSFYKEGCLSFPTLQEEVLRSDSITIDYLDKDFNHQIKEFNGLFARVIQHEYDHVNGVVFIDKINPLKRKMLSGKLKSIVNKKLFTNYKIK